MEHNYVKKQFDIMQRQLAQLEQLMLLYPVQHTSVTCTIPPTPDTQNQKPGTTQSIDPRIALGKHAVVEAIQSYKDLHIIRGLSKQHARQTPGAILFAGIEPTQAQNLIETIEQINLAKNNIKDFITTNYHTRNERFTALKEQCPATITMHLYRNIRIMRDQDIKAIRFTWIRKENLLKISSNTLFKRITEALNHSQDEDSHYTKTLQQLAQAVRHTPEGQLRLRREAPSLQPCVNITYTGKKEITQTQVPMPLIVIQQSTPTVKPLLSYSEENRAARKGRSDKIHRKILGKFEGSFVEEIQNGN